MKRNIIAMTALAIAAAFVPAGLQAKNHGQTVQAGRLSLLPPIVLASNNTDRSELSASLFSFPLVDNAATIKKRSMSHDWQDSSLTVKIVRAKSQRWSNDLTSPNFNRYSVMATDIGMVQEVSGRDSISAGLSYALENRRPSINIAAHNIYRTGNIAATLGWTRHSAFRLSTSVFSTEPITQRSDPERLVEIAGGAAVSAQGVSLTASFSPIRDFANFGYGLELRNQLISQRDAALFGGSSGRSDARLAIFLRKSF
ncbi:hypothetical protein [Sphingorhabdus sp.]|uniref:hypothetical protein n=1 Tax=Sphingorhabdus sp. TaxID=1902408 RepID=UPI003983BA01